MEHQIRFPHLGIVLKNVGDGINIGGFEIKYYGMIIATGFLAWIDRFLLRSKT